jgi:hypothetical protein
MTVRRYANSTAARTSRNKLELRAGAQYIAAEHWRPWRASLLERHINGDDTTVARRDVVLSKLEIVGVHSRQSYVLDSRATQVTVTAI